MDEFLPSGQDFSLEGGTITVSAASPEEFEELQAYLRHLGGAPSVLSPNVANRENIRGKFTTY